MGIHRVQATIKRRWVLSMGVTAVTSIAWLMAYRSTATTQFVVPSHGQAGRYELSFLSASYRMDRPYESMQGPYTVIDHMRLLKGVSGPELLWIDGLGVDVVTPDGGRVISPEFFCHSNLSLSPDTVSTKRPQATFGRPEDLRLATLVPGRLSLKFPPGLGLPVYSDEAVDYLSMPLDLAGRGDGRDVRFRTTISLVRDQFRQNDIKPLFRRAVYGFEKVGNTASDPMSQGHGHAGHGSREFVGQPASRFVLPAIGAQNTMHWMIPPGRYERGVDVTDQLDLPFDTTVHYVTAHLHPYAESVSLNDKTAARTLVTIRAHPAETRRGIVAMDEWSDLAGLPLIRGHQYELVTRYNNTTTGAIDAMSIVYLYASDKAFHLPTDRR